MHTDIQYPTAMLTPKSEELGIDLVKRGHEVRKLLFAGFGARIARSGYDPEEVLQEVYRGILARNKGKCPFDARKSSFGHYVHMVCECILNNYHRKETRRAEVEQVGLIVLNKGNTTLDEQDVATAVDHNRDVQPARQDEQTGVLIRFLKSIPENPSIALTNSERADIRLIVPYMIEGRGQREIMMLTGLSNARVASATHLIRQQVRMSV